MWKIQGLLILVVWIGFSPTALLFAQPAGSSVSQGPGSILVSDLLPSCPSNHITPLGEITSSDGQVWQVPAATRIQGGPFLADLYNSCTGTTPTDLSGLNLEQIPVVEIDPDGELITGYLFSDNYVELYINGVFVGADPIAFTPFNSCVARFRVSRPYTIAVKLVDWEENPGLGTEIQGSNTQHPGDGGFIARFSDGTVSSLLWKAQTFYIAPLENPSLVSELAGGVRSSAGANLSPTCANQCFALHFPVPEAWANPSFDDASWPAAFPYTAAQVTNQAAYTQFASSAWAGASFIWSSNLILDNLVLARYTVPALTGTKSPRDSKKNFQLIEENEVLRISGKEGENFQWQILDLVGKVYSGDLGPNATFPVKRLPSGRYWAKVQSENQVVYLSILHLCD